MVFLTLIDDRVDVERAERAEVDQLGVDAVIVDQVLDRRAHDALKRPAVADDRDVLALALDVGDAERQREVGVVGDVAVVVQHLLGFEEDDRIVAADGSS